MTRYIGKQPSFGNFVKLDAISVVNGQAAYTMQNSSSNFTSYDNVNQFIVSLNGVIQAPTDSFTVSGSTITFVSNLVTGDVIDFILVLGDVLSVGTVSDNTISTAKLQTTSVTADKLGTDSVIEAKIQDDAVTKAKVNFISDGTAGVEVKGDGGSNDGYIQLNCSQNSHGIKLKSPNHSSGQSYTLTFPSTSPATDKFLQTDSSGNLSFADAGGGILVGMKYETDDSPSGTTSTSSGSFQDTGTAFTYTPAATTSKVWFNLSFMGSMGGGTGQYKVTRTIGGTETDVVTKSIGANLSSHSSGNYDIDFNFWYEDSPSTTSEITYKIKIKGNNPHVLYYNFATIFFMETSA